MTVSLLGANDPAPIGALNKDGTSVFVFESEHAGNCVPERLGTLGLSDADLEDHIGWDLHISAVGELISDQLMAPYFFQRYSRLVIDCNRPPDSPESILAVSDNRSIPGNEGLSDAEMRARQQEIFFPFHEAVAEALDRRAKAGQPTILVTLHSFTPAMKKGGADRPWQITFQYGRDPRLSKQLIQEMRADTSICVGDNVPYPVSDETHYGIPVHGEQRNLLHTMIEIRQDVIATAEGQQVWADKICAALTRVSSDMGVSTAD